MLRTIFSFFLMVFALLIIVPLMVLLIAPLWVFTNLVNGLYSVVRVKDSSWSKIIVFEPNIGWKPASDLESIYYYDANGDRGSITTGKDGWPGNHTIEESDIVVFGDSFAFGYGSEYEKAYYSQIDKLLVKPIAAPGYNMVQAVLLMKKYKEKLQGKLIFWLICLENDLAENIQPYNSLHYQTPFLTKKDKTGDWKINDTHVSKKKWLGGNIQVHNTLKFATLCSPSVYSDKVFSGCKFLIEEAKSVCEQADSELVLFTIPDKRQLTSKGIQQLKKHLVKDSEFNENIPDIRLQNICKNLGISLIPGKEHLTIHDYKEHDTHWSTEGNRKLSILIKDYYHTRNKINTI